MARFQLIEGVHYCPQAVVNPNVRGLDRMAKLEKGGVIESDEDLVAKYQNKFRRVVETPPIAVSEERKRAVDALIEGGTWTEEDRTFLQEMGESHFNRITNQAGVTRVASSPSASTRVTSPLGDDVTDTYQRAYDEGLKVFRNAAGKFQVTRSNNTKKPLNREPLDEPQVSKFIDDLLKG